MFNLDEYAGLPPEHPQSYRHFMNVQLFNKVNIDIKRTHVPNGCALDLVGHCSEYEKQVSSSGGIDLQLLGIGVNGHIGFNEPGSALTSSTRVVQLRSQTVRDNARFFGSVAQVPRCAVTMGFGTILKARRILLIATGEAKSLAVRQALEGTPSADCPASLLQLYADVTFLLDEDAASRLTYAVPTGRFEPVESSSFSLSHKSSGANSRR
jgi:glucosamine-6-phosphate deaminase